jgi:hypothetical protein
MKTKARRFCPFIPGVVLACMMIFAGVVTPANTMAGTMTQISTTIPSGFSPGHMLLLSDGRVLMQDSGNNGWKFFLPDSSGQYSDGSFSNCASMHDTRLYGASDVLPDGRVFVAGGEYGSGMATAEIFDPRATNGFGSWTYINPPNSLLNPLLPTPLNVNSNLQAFLDSESMVLPNGNVLVAPVNPGVFGGTLIYNPTTSTWSEGGVVHSCSGNQDECGWVKLPGDSILTIDNCYEGTGGAGTATAWTSERYIPASNSWVLVQNAPGYMFSASFEIGAPMLMTNGQVLYFGGNNKSAIYTPSPLGGTNSGTWSPGPDIPAGLVMRDAPACTLNNGKMILAFPTPTNDYPFYIYEYDPGTGTYSSSPVFTETKDVISDECSMLQLPDGDVLFDDTTNVYVYRPDPSPLAAGQPAIQSVSWNADGSLHLTGTLFNGISQGAMYGDEYHQDSNYPLVSFTDGSGNVTYGRTYNWSSTSVQTGPEIVTTECAVPANVYKGLYSIRVIANGNDSAPVSMYMPVWVDFNYTGATQNGSYAAPYKTLANGVSAVATGGTIAINGSIQPSTSTETPVLSKVLSIIGVPGPALIGH